MEDNTEIKRIQSVGITERILIGIVGFGVGYVIAVVFGMTGPVSTPFATGCLIGVWTVTMLSSR